MKLVHLLPKRSTDCMAFSYLWTNCLTAVVFCNSSLQQLPDDGSLQQNNLQTPCLCCWQISVDFAWSPHGIDGRNFDWPGLASAADIVFLMMYDMQSQVCI